MARIKKVVALAGKCIKEPAKIGRGIKYVAKNGFSGIKEKAIISANYEYDFNNRMKDLSRFTTKFSVVMPTYNVEPKWLEKAINSVINQNYSLWELCIVDDCSTSEETTSYLKTIKDNRIKIQFSEVNKGISEATNSGVAIAEGDYILLLDNDDVLDVNAMYEFAEVAERTQADIIYSDHDIIDENDVRTNPMFKPSWSPDLMRCQMYVGHLLGFKKSLFDEVGGFRTEFNGSQDYDLFLRMSEKTSKIEHVEKVLYSWRALPSSTAANPDSKPYAQIAGQKAVQEHVDRIYGKNKARVDETENYYVYDVRYLMEDKPKVSLIIPTKDHVDLLSQLIDSIFELTDYPNYELIILNNNSEQEESYRYFEKITAEKDNVFVHNVFLEFNWSYLNNYGMQVANGEVYIFLNNDTQVISRDWMERLAENAIRDDVGVVGPMLLYEDDTIQHAGVVIGMNGWADHVFKEMQPVHYGAPYVSPMVTRNVLAVTGACMAISKKTIEKIGAFNDDFIICGSDVEICLRAYQNGLKNIFTPFVKLYHFESKSRDSYIPECDFIMSDRCYAPYRGKDPYFNSQLDYYSCQPKIDYQKIQVYGNGELEENIVIDACNKYFLPETTEYSFRLVDYPNKRLNLLVPSINPEHVFGGISTALKFFYELCEKTGYDYRLILTDSEPHEETKNKYSEEYAFVACDEESDEKKQIIAYASRYNASIPVSKNDYFVATGWWTAYCLQEAYRCLEKSSDVKPNPIIYFIQDYEPFFYSWSSKHLLAESTYKSKYPHVGVFNSKELYENMKEQGYSFDGEYVFNPVFNAGLKSYFIDKCMNKNVSKKKQILIYGRPGTERNAFEIIVMSLSKWVWIQDDIAEWEILSAGEDFNDIDLGNGKVIKSVGKVSIEEYAQLLEESFAGISLMVSPHPSYPPLEMATFGVKVITNKYANKDLSYFSDNIISIDDVTPFSIAERLTEICNGYNSEICIEKYNKEYVEGEVAFDFIDSLVEKYL